MNKTSSFVYIEDGDVNKSDAGTNVPIKPASDISVTTKPMTNYNERLYEILMAFKRYPYGTIAAPHISGDEAKQALTSLTKELVAEAKPGKYSSGESILNVDGIGEVDGYEGYNQAVDQFEQNLLKALEEV